MPSRAGSALSSKSLIGEEDLAHETIQNEEHTRSTYAAVHDGKKVLTLALALYGNQSILQHQGLGEKIIDRR